jgi:hypothetical protein
MLLARLSATASLALCCGFVCTGKGDCQDNSVFTWWCGGGCAAAAPAAVAGLSEDPPPTGGCETQRPDALRAQGPYAASRPSTLYLSCLPLSFNGHQPCPAVLRGRGTATALLMLLLLGKTHLPGCAHHATNHTPPPPPPRKQQYESTVSRGPTHTWCSHSCSRMWLRSGVRERPLRCCCCWTSRGVRPLRWPSCCCSLCWGVGCCSCRRVWPLLAWGGIAVTHWRQLQRHVQHRVQIPRHERTCGVGRHTACSLVGRLQRRTGVQPVGATHLKLTLVVLWQLSTW